MKRRIFYKDILNHCYQRTVDGGVLFYSYSDHLVYFTHYCTMARKYQVQVLSLCQMPDHVHDSVRAGQRKDLEWLKRSTNRLFSKKRNAWYGLSGQLFESPFGSAPKFGEKAVRTNLIYVANNPVERHLVSRAENYRWNYLAYAVSDHPFSERLIIRESRWPLVKAVREVRAQCRAEKPLNYAELRRLFGPLDRKERLQLTDFIISSYNVIDYEAAYRFFGTFDQMLAAMHVSTGSEYDLSEPFVGRSDTCYARMSAAIRQLGLQDIREVLSLPVERRVALIPELKWKTDAPDRQIAKYLHLP